MAFQLGIRYSCSSGEDPVNETAWPKGATSNCCVVSWHVPHVSDGRNKNHELKLKIVRILLVDASLVEIG